MQQGLVMDAIVIEKASRLNGGTDAVRAPLLDSLLELSRFLEETSAPFLSTADCQQILKSLLIFAQETPITAAGNLLKSDQVTDVSIYNLYSSAQTMDRNWQWIFHLFLLNTSKESLHQQLAWVKSKAVDMGRLMTTTSSSDDAYQSCSIEYGGGSYASFVVGYWLFKLYEARYPEVQTREFPDCLKAAYQGFLEWKGQDWDKELFTASMLKDVYDSLCRSQQMQMVKMELDDESSWNGPFDLGVLSSVDPEKVYEFCKGIGTKLLRFYLSRSVNCTLEEFRRRRWNRASSKRAVSCEEARVNPTNPSQPSKKRLRAAEETKFLDGRSPELATIPEKRSTLQTMNLECHAQ